MTGAFVFAGHGGDELPLVRRRLTPNSYAPMSITYGEQVQPRTYCKASACHVVEVAYGKKRIIGGQSVNRKLNHTPANPNEFSDPQCSPYFGRGIGGGPK